MAIKSMDTWQLMTQPMALGRMFLWHVYIVEQDSSRLEVMVHAFVYDYCVIL